MASSNSSSLGARLLNATTFITTLSGYNNYIPYRATESSSELQTLLEASKAANNSEAAKLQSYSLAVENRQKLFSKDDDCLAKLLSPIGASVKAQYGKDSKEANDIMSLISKCRSPQYSNTQKLAKNASKSNNTTDTSSKDVFVSQSELSYGSLTQTFSDIISALSSLTPTFSPANSTLQLNALLIKLEQLNAVNAAVSLAYANLTRERNVRDELFSELQERCQRVKEAIKSQFGNSSTEYTLIKSLKI